MISYSRDKDQIIFYPKYTHYIMDMSNISTGKSNRNITINFNLVTSVIAKIDVLSTVGLFEVSKPLFVPRDVDGCAWVHKPSIFFIILNQNRRVRYEQYDVLTMFLISKMTYILFMSLPTFIKLLLHAIYGYMIGSMTIKTFGCKFIYIERHTLRWGHLYLWGCTALLCYIWIPSQGFLLHHQG